MVRQMDSLPVRNYTFRLQDSPPLNASPEHYSRHGDTIIYKEKIDSLFREKHSSTPNSEVSVTSSHIDASVEHLRSHFQKVMKEPRTPSTPLTPSSVPEPNNASQGKTVVVVKPGGVAVNGQNAHRSKSIERAPSFIKARTAVQAQIEKMFSDATKASENGNQSTISTTISSGTVAGSSSTSPAKIPVRNDINAPDRSNQSVLPPGLPSVVAALTPLERKSPSDMASMVLSPNPTASIPNNTNVLKSVPPAPLAPSPPLPSADSASTTTPKLVDVKYAVDYLGSVVLQERATNLEALQIPLKDLYFRYRSMLRQGHTDYEATLDISANGLRIQPFKDNQPTILNAFPTIAVWAAIKFVYRKEISSHGSLERKFAFLPLICDPENQEKQSLFHHLNIDDVDYATGNHPPMFTCVMRNTGTPKLLECHAFVCGNAEDAIVIAATLYQALLRNMKTVEQKRPGVAQNPPPLPPPNKPVSTQQTASSNKHEEQQYSPASSTSGWSEVLSDGEGHPIRPPRRKKGKSRIYNDSDSDGPGVERRKSLRSSTRSTRSRSSMRSNLRKSMRHSQRTRERIKRTISDRQLGNMLTEPGDILTKVAIPRSKSFMNVPQNYTVDEIFEEIRVKENITSVDDVLKLIVNREGMSFNDLKPAYKELLLKLAFTMSKDEMYLRSKSIMKGQQLPKVKSTLRRDQSPLGQQTTGSSGSKFGSVLKATKKSLSKWGHNRDKKSKSNNKKLHKTQTTLSTATSSSDSLGTSKSKAVTSPIISHAMDCGCVGNQSCVLCAHKAGSKIAPKTPMPARNARGPAMTCNDCGYDSETCYSEKCYCSLPRGSHSNNHSHHLSKHSVCNCDADESCAESEKCYCSLQRLKPNGVKVYNINLDSDTDTSHSSSVQVKPASYQQQANRQQQQTRHSSITSWASLSGAESPMTAWRRNTRNFSTENSSQLRHKSSSSSQFSDDLIRPKTSFSQSPELLGQKSSSTMGESVSGLSSTSTSTSFLLSAMRQTNQNGFNSRLEDTDTTDSTLSTSSHRRPRSYSTDNISMTESAFRRLNSESSSDTASRSSGDSIKTTRSAESNQKRVLVVSAVDQRGKIVYRGSQRGGPAQNSLSMKKTTEIAALFSNLKLDQTTDIIENLETASECSIDDAYSTMKNPHAFSDSNLENSLGYLP